MRILADYQSDLFKVLRKPRVALSVICLIALGMGGITAVFNPIYSTLFAPLLLPHPEQLVRIGGDIPLFNVRTSRFDKEEILGKVFSNIAAYGSEQTAIRIPDMSKQVNVNGLIVSEDFFETIGVKPLIGCDCTKTEGKNGLVISHRFWRNELKQKTDAINSYILLSDGRRQVSIIGIMPENFNFPFDTDIWLCRSDVTWYGYNSNGMVMNYMGRLHSGITYGQAAEFLRNNFKPVTSFVGSLSPSSGPLLQSLQTALYGDQSPLLRILAVAAILFLVLACAGVVNIFIVQGVRRKPEITIRLIHGAMRRNLVFQLLRETFPLIVIGGFASWWISEVVSKWIWTQIPMLHSGTVNVPVKITFLAVLVLGVMLIGGLIPALYATSNDLSSYLKSPSTTKRKIFSSQELLVGVQLSVTLALLIGIGIMIRGMIFNIDIPVGWSSQDIAIVSVTHSGPAYVKEGEESRYAGLNQDIQNELRTMPEVISVGFLSPIPFSAAAISQSRIGTLVSKTPQRLNAIQGIPHGTISTMVATANADGFGVLGISLVAGRHFTYADTSHWLDERKRSFALASGMVIINQALAQRLWPGDKNVIGKVFYNINTPSYEVVGVVRNYHHVPENMDFLPTMYIPYTGIETGANFLLKLRPNTFFQNFQTNVRQRLAGYTLDWVEVLSLNEQVKNITANQRLALQFLSCIAILSVIVSGVAVYANATLATVSRTKEIGIRMSMGAKTWDILKLALWSGIRAILLGLPFGLFLALVLSKVLSSFIVHVYIGVPFVWVISCTVLLVITTVAALIPTLRAAFLNPLDAIHDE